MVNGKWKITKERIILFLILSLFLITRLYKITQIPPSVYWDEASIGYNAYSVLKTSKDEWGEFLPLHFRAFGEFKLPVYIYSTALSIEVFGMNEFAVRFPAVMFGLASCVLLYLLAEKLSGNKEVGLLASFIFVVIPWTNIFTRAAYEATAGLAFCLIAIYMGLLALEKPKLLLLSALAFIVSMYSYNSFRILSPIIFLAILVYGIQSFVKNKRVVFLAFALFFLSLVPVYRLFVYDWGLVRYSAVSVGGQSSSIIVAMAKNYLTNFSANFLFLAGDTNPRSNYPGYGEVFPFSILFIILGIYCIYRTKNNIGKLVIFLLLISPIPAAITKESPHALRSILMAPFLAIVIAWGIYFLANFRKKTKTLVYICVLGLYAFAFLMYETSFLKNYTKFASSEWQYQYKKILADYEHQIQNSRKVVITDEYAQPYIFVLFYAKYSPQEFRNQVVYNSVDRWGFSTVASFGKFVFKEPQVSDLTPQTLVFSKNKIEGINPTGEVKLPDGRTYLYVYKV